LGIDAPRDFSANFHCEDASSANSRAPSKHNMNIADR
jgi:hypothetical protein